MGEFSNQRPAKSAKPGIITGGDGGGSEIVEVQGGRIVRSIGRKDRHSKVCTAKGPRDRRVRLSAHTAIEFYDVQDRLGYDRPSKAVDWLIKKAKPAIDKLRELPGWNPNVLDMSTQKLTKQAEKKSENKIPVPIHPSEESASRISSRRANFLVGDGGISECTMQNLQNISTEDNHNSDNSNFLPPSFDSDSIVDTFKSFLPVTTTAAAETPSSIFEFDTFPPDLLSRTSSRTQDLRLSLQSLQGPTSKLESEQTQQNDHLYFSGTTPLGCFDGWSEQQPPPTMEISRFQRILHWSTVSASGGGDGKAGGVNGEFLYNSQPTISSFPPPSPPLPILQPLFGENQLVSQRGPLQSSYTPSIRAWIDPSIAFMDNQQQLIPPSIYQSSFPGLGFATGGFSKFLIPTRIPGEEEHDGISEKPSSASSNSRH